MEPPITRARRWFGAFKTDCSLRDDTQESCRNAALMPTLRGCSLPAPSIASPQPYNRPFTAAFGGSHGRTQHRPASFCGRLGGGRRNACHRARICSRRLSLTTGDVRQSVSARRRHRRGRTSVRGGDRAVSETAGSGRDQARRRRRGRRAVRREREARRLHAAAPHRVDLRLRRSRQAVRPRAEIHARQFHPDRALHRRPDGARRQ